METDKKNGDYSTNVAFLLTKELKKSPMLIAEDIANNIKDEMIEKVEIANPGFINIFLSKKFLLDNINKILEEDAQLCLGFKPDADVEGGKTDAEGYYGIFKGMMEEFGFKYVVSTLRESLSATHNGWKALIYDGQIIKNGCLWRFITKNAN